MPDTPAQTEGWDGGWRLERTTLNRTPFGWPGLPGQVDGVHALALAAAVVVADHADVVEPGGLRYAQLAAG